MPRRTTWSPPSRQQVQSGIVNHRERNHSCHHGLSFTSIWVTTSTDVEFGVSATRMTNANKSAQQSRSQSPHLTCCSQTHNTLALFCFNFNVSPALATISLFQITLQPFTWSLFLLLLHFSQWIQVHNKWFYTDKQKSLN